MGYIFLWRTHATSSAVCLRNISFDLFILKQPYKFRNTYIHASISEILTINNQTELLRHLLSWTWEREKIEYKDLMLINFYLPTLKMHTKEELIKI